MISQAKKARRFLSLHQGDEPLLLPNAWDAGSAKLLASLGFKALATTSSGHAATLGQLDGSVTRDQALEHAATIVDATELPVSADLAHARPRPQLRRARGRSSGERARPYGASAGQRAWRDRGQPRVGRWGIRVNALGALLEAAEELRDQGTYAFSERAAKGARAGRSAFR